MGRGYVVGLLVGALFSSVSVGALSLMLPPVGPILPPETPQAAAPEAGEAPETQPETQAAGATAPAEPEAEPMAETATAAPEAETAAAPEAAAPAVPETPPAAETPAAAPEDQTAAAPADETAEGPAAPEPQTAPEPQVAPEPAPAETASAAPAAGARPEAPVVDVPAGSEFNRPKPEEDPVLPAPQPAPSAATAPVVSAPLTEDGPVLTERTPAAIPEGQAVAPATLPEPAPAPQPVAEAPAAEAAVPVPPPGDAVAPDLAPVTADEGFAPDDAPGPVAAAEPAPEAAAEPQVIVPLPPELPTTQPGAAPVILPVPDTTAEGQIIPAPGAPDQEAGAGPAGKPRILTPGSGRGGTENGPTIIDIAPTPPIGATGPTVGFGQKTVPGVRVNRLPSIGAAEPSPPEAAPDAAGDDSAAPVDERAVARFAAAFENPEQKPLIAVILIDDAGAGGGAEPDTVAELGAPVTVALNPERADVAALAQTYRLSGDEIAILAPDMPAGATPSDVEVSYQSFVQSLPDSIALIAAPDSDVQGDRRAAQHMAALLGAEGRGLVTYARGLNPARQAAERAGIPYAGIARSLDEAGQDDAAMQRLLDRAAFDATRGGSVVLIGRATPVTVAALKGWIEAGRKEAVIGPLSAVLKP